MPEKSNRNFNHTNQKRESIKQDGYIFIYIKKKNSRNHPCMIFTKLIKMDLPSLRGVK